MPVITFSLNIPAIEYQRYYRGIGHTVVVEADDGRTLEFPAVELRRYVTHSGVQGRFRIDYDGANRLVSLNRTA